MTQTILITGATDGIGLEIARQAAAAGAKTIIVARDAAKLESVAAALEGPNRPETAVVDLTDPVRIDAFLADLDARGIVPDVLINNAGHGASGAFAESDWPKLEAMLRVNVAALAQLSHWGARRMKAKGRGAIVNLSAAVATRPTPFFAAYAASKAFVTSLSLATDNELRRHGVTVSVVHPPAVRTSFADSAKADLRSTLVLKLFPSVSAASVARTVLRVARSGRRSAVVGPIAAIIMATAPIMPRGVDLAFMSLLFKGRRAPAAMNMHPGE
jgi:short-subunit dehydrogenase